MTGRKGSRFLLSAPQVLLPYNVGDQLTVAGSGPAPRCKLGGFTILVGLGAVSGNHQNPPLAGVSGCRTCAVRPHGRSSSAPEIAFPSTNAVTNSHLAISHRLSVLRYLS